MTPSGPEADHSQVLVIDDSEVDRTLIIELLESAGIRAQGLPSPIGATREVRRIQASVVVIDQNMPVMDGSKLTRLFRENRSMQGVRVVLVSGNDTAAMRETAEEVHADAFLPKADLPHALVPTIRNMLRRL